MSVTPSYLQDRWQSGTGAGTALVNPVSSATLAHASSAGLDLGTALQHARLRGGPALRALSFAQRGDLLDALAKAIYSVRDELLEVSMANTGVTRSDAKFDIDGGTATLSSYAALGRELGSAMFLTDGAAEQLGRSPRFAGRHIRVPLRGVAVHINAFNFPIWGLAEKLACAFLAGMPVLCKPATATALPTARAAKAMTDSGLLPAGSFSLLVGSVGDLLDHLGAQDVIAFTGSADTGAKIRSHRAVVERSVRVNIEADSLNAVVVGPDVQPGSACYELFLRELVREITQKSGQKCTATRRVLLPAALVGPVSDALRERLLPEYLPKTPTDATARMGALATPSQATDVLQRARELATHCDVVVGALPAEPTTLFPPCVLLAKNSKTAALHSLEVFGPMVTLLPYDGSVVQAAELVALGEGTLVTTVYSDDLEFTTQCVEELAPWTGRLLLGSARIAEFSTGPGLVLPNMAHGGPGRAGGGLELGGVRGLSLYMQTCAVQGARPVLDRLFPAP
ncbi:MAG: 3,4-dehydroadipyl-CoA semialdehyde dehydrogenase [Planctomycetes bacterium]|nr:3,4-dehydroadipyl-CoA semialdehyde dehydrogenase [Planctomycetota bacterium]